VTACCDIDVITFGHTICRLGPPKIPGYSGTDYREVNRPVIVDPLPPSTWEHACVAIAENGYSGVSIIRDWPAPVITNV
jgi:hypothetical protein